MAKGITGSGGVDTSALDGLISKLNSVLDTQQEINQIKIKPQADDSDIQKVKRSVEDLWNEARNTNRTKLELWDTKTVQKEIGNITAKLEELAKSFDISKESSESISLTEKEFLRLYATLKQYSDKFGQEISSTYKNMFNSIFKNADVFKQDYLSEYFNKQLSSASDTLNKSMSNITFEANETYVKNISEALKQEQAEAKRSAEAVSEAERKKRAEYIATRDAMVNDLKSAFNDIKSTAKDGQYLNIDEQSWGVLQQKFYDLTQLMSQMGFEVKEIEDSFGQLQNKVYVPTEQIDAARNSFKGIATEAEETVGEIDRMTSSLSNINNPEVDKLRSELESLRDLYHRACTDAWELEEANKQMYSPDEYAAVSGAASEYWMQLEKLKEEFTELQQKYNAIINTGSSGENALSKTFDINNVDKFVDILTQISQHLNDIKNTLGTVDDTNGFTNIINSVDILLEKLDEVRAKVGTGINNITINQSVDKTAQEQSAATSDYLRSTMSRYKNAYSKVTNAAGSEEKLFAYINTAINFKGGIDELYKTFSAASVSEIQTAEGQIYRLIDFFKVLREAMSSENFELNLSGIRLPSSDDTNFRSQLRKKSGVKKSDEEVLNLEDEKINLTEITDKLEEIRELLSEISQKDLFGDSLNRVSQKLDEIVGKFDSIVAKVEVINSNPILTENQNVEAQEDTNAKQTASEVQKATEAVREEGNAAEEAAKKKQEFADANKKVAESATNTAATTKEAVDGIKKEGNAAKEAAGEINAAGESLERYIRRQRGNADSGNYDYTQAINQVADKQVRTRTDNDGVTTTTETLIVNYDKLSRRLVSLDTEILNLQHQINNTTQGNIQPLQDNLAILQQERDVYEDILTYMIQQPEYEIDDSQATVLRQQRDYNENFIRNIQAANDSIAQLRQNEQTVSLGLSAQLKSRELDDYVTMLRDLNLYTPQVDQAVQQLVQDLGNITTPRGLSDWVKQFEIFKSDTKVAVDSSALTNKIDLKTREVDDYVAELRELGIYTPQVEQAVLGLYNALNSVTTPKGLKDWDEQFKILKSDMHSVITGTSLNLDVGLKSRELDDYIEELKKLGIYTPQVKQVTDDLYNSLNNVSSTKGLNNWVKNFNTLKSDMASSAKGAEANLNTVIKQQASAYKNIWTIRKKIASLDSVKDSNLITELNAQQQIEEQIYGTKLKELAAINTQIAREQHLYNDTVVRKQAENEIKNIKAKQNDSDVVSRYNLIISKYKEIKKLNTEIQGLISYGVDTNDPVISNRQTAISTIESEIAAINRLGISKEQETEINKALASAYQVVDDAQAKRAATGALEQQQIDKTRNSLLQQASALKNNGKLMRAYGDDVNNFIKQLQDTNVTKEKLEEIRVGLMNIRTQANLAGESGKTFGQILTQRFTSLGAYLSTFASFYRVILYIRSSITILMDLDTQLVDLRKTTSMTTSELNDFYNSSSDVAKQLGVTTSEIISQASAWSRLGYSTQEASTRMAELSSMFASISPGMTTDNSTDYLVSTMQAYGIAVDDVKRKILDNVNKIGNTFATTNAEIGEMLTRSSAAMKAANNTLEETIALESAAVQITRNAETTGTAFRTISMRIRGYDEETEELSGDLENISGDIYDLTKVNGQGISIFTDESRKTYKSTYEILKEISEVWDELTDKQQADLLDKLGGKRGAQSIAGILADFDEVERAMTNMENAGGSAEQEMSIIRDSLEYKINALKQTWVGTLQAVTDRGEIGKWVDNLTFVSEKLSGIISEVGLLKTAIIGISTIIGSQKLG